jgi:hypothetical protein
MFPLFYVLMYYIRFGKSDLYEKILFCREIPCNMTFIRFRISDSFEQSRESRQIESSCTKRAILTKSRALAESGRSVPERTMASQGKIVWVACCCIRTFQCLSFSLSMTNVQTSPRRQAVSRAEVQLVTIAKVRCLTLQRKSLSD